MAGLAQVEDPPAVHGEEDGPEVGPGGQEDDDAAAEVEVVEGLEQPLERDVTDRQRAGEEREREREELALTLLTL